MSAEEGIFHINLSEDLVVKWAEDLLLYSGEWNKIVIFELPDETWDLIAYK